MELKQLSCQFAVTGQVAPGDMAVVASQGFRTVVCNRPDHEGSDQPEASQLEAAAARQGLRFEYLPIVPGQATDLDARRLARILDETQSPVLAFCRSGARAESLWRRARELSGD
ncbi:hypothetical protein GCM10011515_21690 [Tsuneonella deserti]|uniref:Beta-lactamase hydrolase-like protein phosphatase-like domain-containing protein n=1 Tax=Tsuneonella deserti TaxID=2035528 RepID=A0ABQ1S9Y9_9SPHN|nr:TIGR01244 family sulfur transferase [Tsuneonella deserti]GGE01632.1 hypothetical protein GCM10011515_21690 [Tsuneonella deserti]